MTSSFSYATAATLEHEPLCVLNDHRKQEGCSQPVSDQPTYCIRAAGVLRYNRESDNQRINFTTVLPAPPALAECAVKCEYCGEKARPSLGLTWLQEPETTPLFCCAQWQQLCVMLVRQRCLFEGRCDLKTGTPTSLEDKPSSGLEELLFKGREMQKHNKFMMDLPGGLGTQSELRIHEDYSVHLPVAETFAPTSKVLSFRLSCAPGKGSLTMYPNRTTENCFENEGEEAQALVRFCDHKPLQFGICRHQDGAEFLHKYYSNGMKFLTSFHDGSAQVFYPSGILALVVVVTKENGRVCIVYDDSDTPNQPIRAVFQSDGRAACYHSNGNIWLSLNRSGGQCLDEAGARVRRWSWSSVSLTPTPLHPVFLSLNKTVGVRVLGKEQVFVSFLAQGQQAKFSVGTCCAQGESKTDGAAPGPSVMKEELFVLAARTRIHLVIQHLHQYLMTPSHPQLPKTTQAPHLHVVAQKLLEVSAHVTMNDRERAFIQKCLQDLSTP
ncbi:glutamate-rich protein 6-like isoform X1 [Seriola dumerili]|uniref:glutamate-rich protein 6-like isoform X1 n=1 Tax=Seriola dumerili TaxID=41447 RepID=UPI000BBE30DE|nr:glutamate-rich protein 6-like isoform X1 [Seriola dumerili]